MRWSIDVHIDAAIEAGELEEARELIEWIEPRAQRVDRPWALALAARGRALLAAAEGDPAASDAAFASAYEQHARRPQQFPTFGLARTLLAHGTTSRRRRQKRLAHDRLEQALEIFERLGAASWAAKARSELARIGGRSLATGELSETERQIAERVGEGRSNKEVAAALSLSPKTVEWNLSKVYAKLGVRSRASSPPVARSETRGCPRLHALPRARRFDRDADLHDRALSPGMEYTGLREAVRRAAAEAAAMTTKGVPVRYLG